GPRLRPRRFPRRHPRSADRPGRVGRVPPAGAVELHYRPRPRRGPRRAGSAFPGGASAGGPARRPSRGRRSAALRRHARRPGGAGRAVPSRGPGADRSGGFGEAEAEPWRRRARLGEGPGRRHPSDDRRIGRPLMSTPAGGELRREVGLAGAVLVGLGSMVGTGVFVSLSLAVDIAGSAVLWAVAAAAVVALCNGLSSAQLAAAHPVAGGTY